MKAASTDFFSDVQPLTLKFCASDAHSVLHYHDYGLMQEFVAQECEKEVLQAIKQRGDRFVLIGCCAEYPMVIIDMLTREYNIQYGFVEQRRGYSGALKKQGFKMNIKLHPKTETKNSSVVGYNSRFGVSILHRN